MQNNLIISVKYFDRDLPKLKKIDIGDWIDLRSAIDIHMIRGQFELIPLGIGMILPDGYEAHIAPRSSTFANFGILQTNGLGIVDNSYSGDDDQWMMPVLALRDTRITKGDRICQFRIVQKMPAITIQETEHLNLVSRKGLGSTGKK